MAHGRSLCDLVAWERGLYSVGLRAEEVLGCGGLPPLCYSGKMPSSSQDGGWVGLTLTDENPNLPYLMEFIYGVPCPHAPNMELDHSCVSNRKSMHAECGVKARGRAGVGCPSHVI